MRSTNKPPHYVIKSAGLCFPVRADSAMDAFTHIVNFSIAQSGELSGIGWNCKFANDKLEATNERTKAVVTVEKWKANG